MDRKLQRSKNNKVIAGVCGGVAEYFSIDPTIIRLVWAVVGFAGGFGLLAYIIAAIIIPEAKHQHTTNHSNHGESSSFDTGFNPSEWKDKPHDYDSEKGRLFIGGAIVFLGIFLLFREFFNWIDIKYLIPIILIVIGIGIIYKGRRDNF